MNLSTANAYAFFMMGPSLNSYYVDAREHLTNFSSSWCMVNRSCWPVGLAIVYGDT